MAACNTFNVIYMIQCDLCNLQYIVETKRRLKDALYIDALYLTPPVVTFKPQFQNSFSAIAALFPICYLSQLKHLDMNAMS